MLDIRFAAPALPGSGALGLLVAEGQSASGVWAAADEATGGAVSRAFEIAEFTGKEGQSVTLLAPGAGLSRIVAVGLGKPGEVTAGKVEEASGSLAAALMREKVAAVAADGFAWPWLAASLPPWRSPSAPSPSGPVPPTRCA